MDQISRSIILSLGAVISLTVLAVILALVVPFKVDEPATLLAVSGSAELLIPDQPPVPVTLDETLKLDPGQGVRVLPGSEVRIDFQQNEGYAVVSGPATIRLIDSYRRATALGHALDVSAFKRTDALTLEQTDGTARYFFPGNDLSGAKITIRLPIGNFVPPAPCWMTTIAVDRQTTSEPIDCQ